MKPEQLYQGLKDLAEKIDISVVEHNFRNAGINVKSGLCKVKGKKVFIIDKHKSVYKRLTILSDCLRKIPNEDIYVLPAVRDLLDKKG